MSYTKVFGQRFLKTEEDRRNLEKRVALKYKGNIKDYMTQIISYNMKLGLKGLYLGDIGCPRSPILIHNLQLNEVRQNL
jgi:hypothetical protein